MIEKLLEHWLDSASERSYQAVFVQMLSGLGYRVVHSTRHTALEFGKDILAVAPDGIGCAYQLKGNPGGRLGLSQFRSEIQQQLVQLMSQPVVYPGFPDGAHRAFLVSNGYFDEEVHRAVDDLNRSSFYPSKVALISRGDLMDWCKTMGASLWPSELPEIRQLLEIALSDSSELPPAEKLADLLAKILATDPENVARVGKAAFHRMVTSASLLTGIATAHFAESKNHYATAHAWALLAIMVISAAEKHGHPLTGTVLTTVALAESAALDALTELWEEIAECKHLVEGNPMSDPEIYGWRYGVLLGAMSCLAIADEANSLLDEASGKALKRWLLQVHHGIDLWGEGSIANIVPWLVYIRKNDPTARPDNEIAAVVEAVIERNAADSTSPLPSPYYGVEEVKRAQMGLDHHGAASGVKHEIFAGSAFTAEPLFHLLVRTNLKQKCKSLWPNFSRLSHRGLTLELPWHYGLFKVNAGVEETRIYPRTYEWKQLKIEAISPADSMIPRELIGRSWLLAYWWQVAPHRFNTESCRILAGRLIPGWGS